MKVNYRGVEIVIGKGELGYNAVFTYNGEVENCILNAKSAEDARLMTTFRIDHILSKGGKCTTR